VDTWHIILIFFLSYPNYLNNLKFLFFGSCFVLILWTFEIILILNFFYLVKKCSLNNIFKLSLQNSTEALNKYINIMPSSFKPSCLIIYRLMCLTKNLKFDFHGSSARLRSFKLLINCRKKNQPDCIRFRTFKESWKISLSFPLFIWKFEFLV
jgi:hypothetical protein